MSKKENYPKLELSQIVEWESKNNIEIPQVYREYLLKHNAGYFIPEPNVFDVPKMGRFALANFFGLSDDIYGLAYALKTYRNRFPDKYFPIADDVTGNLILMGQSEKNEGQIFFWYHEMEQDTGKKPYEKNIFKVSKSLNDFVNSLYIPKQESYGKLIDIFDGNDEGIKKLLNSGWDINTPSELNETLIQRAALTNRIWLVEELIKRGVKLDGAIDKAMTNNNVDVLELLLKSGANIEEKNTEMNTPLQEAVLSNNPKMVSLLLKYNSDKNVIDEFGDTPLETALFKKEKGIDMDEIIKLLQ